MHTRYRFTLLCVNNSYTKLFSSIIGSSIWNEDDKTRVLWITMLATADARGEIGGSVGGLAVLARLSKSDCEKSLAKLCAPDEDSADKTNEGRRVQAIDRGWLILNYSKHRERGRHIERAEYLARKQREYRERKKAGIKPRIARRTEPPTNGCASPYEPPDSKLNGEEPSI